MSPAGRRAQVASIVASLVALEWTVWPLVLLAVASVALFWWVTIRTVAAERRREEHSFWRDAA